MEMMNIDAATRMLGNYEILIKGTCEAVLTYRRQPTADAEIAAHIEKLQKTFKDLLRKATIEVTVLMEEAARQAPVLLNFPVELAKLIKSLNAFHWRVEESKKMILQIDPSFFNGE